MVCVTEHNNKECGMLFAASSVKRHQPRVSRTIAATQGTEQCHLQSLTCRPVEVGIVLLDLGELRRLRRKRKPRASGTA